MAAPMQGLPGPLRDLLHRLRGRLRGAWLLRGLGTLLLGSTILFGFFFAIDALIGLPTSALQIAFGIWLVAGLVLLAQKLILPWLRPVADPAVAVLVERKHPELGERLLTLADLSQAEGHASPEMSAALAAETVPLAEQVQVSQVIPWKRPLRWAALGMAGVLLACLPLLVAPSYQRFGLRFFRACFDPYLGFELRALPGSLAIAKDRPVTVTAQLESLDGGPLPRSCHLVVLDSLGEKRLRMPQENAGRFSLNLPAVGADLRYYVEAGEARSDVFDITAVPPIVMAESYPKIRITPPAYVNAQVFKPAELTNPTEAAALQHSQVLLTCRFDRPPQSLKWIQHSDSKDKRRAAPSDNSRWTWSADRLEATLPLPADVTGSFAAHLDVEAEHGIVNQLSLPRWKVWEDRPPVFLSVQQGFTTRGAVTGQVDPDDVLTFRFTAVDDVGLDQVAVEYRVDDGPVGVFVLVKNQGQLTAAGESTFPLRGKVSEGQEIKVRLAARDNRHLPEQKLGPQTAYYPPRYNDQDGWITLKAQRGGDPAQQRDILAQRDEVQQKLAVIRKKVESERAQVGQFRSSLHQHQFLPPDKLAALKKLRQLNQAITDDLVDLARETAPTPLLEILGDKALDLAEGEMKRADQNLGKTEDKDAAPPQREGAMQQAETELLAALKKLDDLAALNHKLAQDRLDLMNLERLAQQEQDLADRIARLEKAGKLDDPMTKDELARLREEQQQLAARLQKLTEQSAMLQKMLPSREAKQARDLAQRARELAQKQRDMADKKPAKNDPGVDPLLELAKQQDELAKTLGTWQTGLPQPPAASLPETAGQAAQAMRRVEIELALDKQEKTAVNLDGLARDFDKRLLKNQSPRALAAKAQDLQEALYRNLEKLGQEFNQMTLPEARAKVAAMLKRQIELVDMLEGISIPDTAKEAQSVHKDAVRLARDVVREFQKRTALEAFLRMEETVPVLRRLAQLAPEAAQNPVAKGADEEKRLRQWGQEARVHEKRQRDLQRALRKFWDQAKQEAGGGAGDQQALKKETDQLADEVMKLSQSKEAGKGKMGAEDAAHSAMAAAKAMDKAKDPDKKGNATEAMKEAALKLEMAAKQMDDAARAMSQGKDGDDPAGKDLEESSAQMNQAAKKLEQGQPKEARQAMQRAAQAMNQAAQATSKMMSKSQRPTSQPNLQSRLSSMPTGGGPGSGSMAAGKLEPFLGRTWGELPGELRTQLLQDLGSRFGEEYAPIIQRYFQQLADLPVVPGMKR